LAARLRALEPSLDGLAPLPATTTEVVTWWPREAPDTAPVPDSRRRATWTAPATAPVSPAVGDTRLGSDLPITALPGGEPAEPGTAVAVASVPAPFVVPAPAPVRKAGRPKLVTALVGAAALLLVLVAVGIGVTMIVRGNGQPGQPTHPVAVVTPQPD